MSFNKKPLGKRRNRPVLASASSSRTSQVSSKSDKVKITKTSVSDLSNKCKSPVKKAFKKIMNAEVPVVLENDFSKADQSIEAPMEDSENQVPQQISEIGAGIFNENTVHDEIEKEKEHNMTYNLLVKSLFAIEGGEMFASPWKMSMEKLDKTIEKINMDMREIDLMYQDTVKKCTRLLRMWEVKQDMLKLLYANKNERENIAQAEETAQETD